LEEEHFDQLPGGISAKASCAPTPATWHERTAVADYLSATAPSSPSELPPSDLPVEMAEQLETREPVRAVHVPWTLFAALLSSRRSAFPLGFIQRGSRITRSPHVQTAADPRVAPTNTNGQSQAVNATPGSFTVAIKAREDSWISITADGKQLSGTDAGCACGKIIEARDEIVIKAGSIGALDFSFNAGSSRPRVTTSK